MKGNVEVIDQKKIAGMLSEAMTEATAFIRRA